VAPVSERDSRRIPALVAWLGYGGLLPFAGLAIAGGMLGPGSATQAMRAYGAVILSFVGALHWGFALTVSGLDPSQRSRLFIWSVVPALLAWLCLLLPPLAASLALIAGFLVHYGWDRRLSFLAQLPAWYLRLRLQLTTMACVCLGCNALWLWRG